MNKTELIEALAGKSGLTKADAGRAVDGVMEIISEALAKGESVTLVGFGTFSVGERAARVGRNPQTGAEIQIAASKQPKFSAGLLKDREQNIAPRVPVGRCWAGHT
jgi:DNA-binding protein HU-beta